MTRNEFMKYARKQVAGNQTINTLLKPHQFKSNSVGWHGAGHAMIAVQKFSE